MTLLSEPEQQAVERQRDQVRQILRGSPPAAALDAQQLAAVRALITAADEARTDLPPFEAELLGSYVAEARAALDASGAAGAA